MKEFTRAMLTHLAVHYVGNKGLGEEITFSNEEYRFKDDFTKDTFLKYLLTPFLKGDKYHKFKKKLDVNLSSVQNISEDLFISRSKFMQLSKAAASLLYNQGMHPKIRAGYFFVAYFKDAIIDGELCDCVGFFKSEIESVYIKPQNTGDIFTIDTDAGMSIKKLDKGCLVYNIDKKDGYKLAIIDNNNKIAEASLYWEEDFLNTTIKTNEYYHTKNFIDSAIGFIDEVAPSLDVTPDAQRELTNTSVNYFTEHVSLVPEEFETEVLRDPALIEAFHEYQQDYNKRLDIATPPPEFNISLTAVKQKEKYLKTRVQLDKSFDLKILVKGHKHIERGFDEDRGMKFMKLFYTNEA